MPATGPAACLAAAVVLAVSAVPAASAPQILALLATGDAVPLTCRDGTCAAEFSGFCLQRKRPDPTRGTQYRTAGGEVTLIVTGIDGEVRRMPAGDHLSIETERGYTAVRLAVPRALLERWNAASVAVEIGERVTLIPVPDAADTDPQTEADIALALGPQRALGARIIADAPVQTGAVRLTNRMIGALPPGRTDGETRGSLWDRVVAPSTAAFPPASVASASSVYRRCLSQVAAGRFFNLRRCLEVGHDALMIDLNVKYWKAGPEG